MFWNLGRNSVVFRVSYGQIVEVDTFFQDSSEYPTNSGNFIKVQGAPDWFNGLERSSGSYVWVHGTEFKFMKLCGSSDGLIEVQETSNNFRKLRLYSRIFNKLRIWHPFVFQCLKQMKILIKYYSEDQKLLKISNVVYQVFFQDQEAFERSPANRRF